MEKFAIIYDFDFTLSTNDSPFFSLFPFYEIDGKEFFKKTEEERVKNDMDSIIGYLYSTYKMALEKGKPLTREILYSAGKNIKFYDGVLGWFDRINQFGRENGFEIEHYIISSGICEIIEGCAIASKFKKIFASSYHYDENGFADWPLSAINYTNKTQFIFRINKGILNNCDDHILNGYMPKEKRAVDYKNMIYIGDGFSDIPCMKTMRDKGGFSIGVYGENSSVADGLIENKRCNRIAKADYRAGQELEKIVQERILTLKNNKKMNNYT